MCRVGCPVCDEDNSAWEKPRRHQRTTDKRQDSYNKLRRHSRSKPKKEGIQNEKDNF